MNWKKAKFGEVFDFQKKSNIKAGDGLEKGKYPFYTSSGILSKRLNEFKYNKPSLIFGTGGMASIHYCDENFAVSTDCFVTQIKDEHVLFPKFVYYYLSGNMHLLEEGFKGAGLKHISKEYLSALEIPILDFNIQQEIAAILDKADALRQKNKQLLVKYDELAQSVYQQLFNEKKALKEGWPKVAFETLADDRKGAMRTGPFGSSLLHSEFVEEGIAVLGIDNAVNNRFEWNQRRFITPKKYDELKRYTIYPEDVIITIMATVGRTAVIPKNIPTAINTKHLAAISLNKKMANPHFISFSLHSNSSIQNQLNQSNRGAIMDGLNLTIIRALKLYLPPVALQNKFAQVLENIENQKQQVEKQLDKSEELFQCLLQKAFAGEIGVAKAELVS